MLAGIIRYCIPSLGAVYRFDSHYETWCGLRDVLICHMILSRSAQDYLGIANRTYLVLADNLEIMVNQPCVRSTEEVKQSHISLAQTPLRQSSHVTDIRRIDLVDVFFRSLGQILLCHSQ